MPQKIFISYRRQDAGANALGIGQYLEHQFGRKSVFIDVDMRAGAKFPEVLEQRLAECKVMLVLIGPEWLNSRDEQGHRRLESPDDWVRLEIGHALKRDITVIPVRVSGAELPARAALPDDIQGLLDHQAVSVTNAGFRNEMSGLARDIRSIPSPRPWRRYGAIAAACLLLLLGAVAAVQIGRLPNVFETLRRLPFLQTANTSQQNDVWSSSPGEWVNFGVSQTTAFAYYFKPSSIKTFGDKVAYARRFPMFRSTDAAVSQNASSQAAYEDETTVIDCKKSMEVLAERTVYNKSGGVISHFQRGDPQSLDLSAGGEIKADTFKALEQRIFCDEQLRTPLQISDSKLTYLSDDGNSEVFYGPTKRISQSGFQWELLYVHRMFQDHDVKELYKGSFPERNIIGLLPSYRASAEPLQVNCSEKRVLSRKSEYFDQKDVLIVLALPLPEQPIDVKERSAFGSLLDVVCRLPIRP
jgi:TIR domain